MRNHLINSLLLFVLCVPMLAQSQGAQYQPGKVITVEKLEDSRPQPGGADAPVKSETHSYNVSIQVGDSVYLCRYHEHTGELESWLKGKEVQVRINGKTMYVKRATGKDARGSILRTTKAETP